MKRELIIDENELSFKIKCQGLYVSVSASTCDIKQQKFKGLIIFSHMQGSKTLEY